MNSFSRDSGPSGPPRTQPTFGTPPSFPSPPNPNPFEKKNDVAAAQSLTRQQPATPRPQGTPPQPERLGTQTSMVFQNGNAETSKRVRPPSLAFENNHSIRNPDYHHEVAQRLGSQTNLLFQNGNAATSKRMRSPPLAFESNFSDPDYDHEEAQRTNFSPPTLGTPKKSPANYANSLQQGFHNANSYTNTRDAGTLSSPKSYFQALKTAGSPPLPSADVFDRSPDTRDAGTHSPLKPSYFNVPKRARSPPLPSADVLSTSSQLNSEREIQAKARRLARFNVELRQPTEKLHDPVKRKPAGNKDSQPSLDKWDADEHAEVAQDISSRGDLSNIEGSQSSIVVVGLCPDMCPESEREERERKGDLDQYERLDGERNQTSKFLAVKKYNRTAERQAYLIRPMPVLQKTVDYLLSLLDQPYNDSFLSIYNFLWDRMRAIRMDLRMQHIFNQQAIVMLEQMIRLHIIAMHELCEYKKGEGFSEGFDAHLNIEQMNKTSVELFQMYDDHRKKGTSVPSEKEFRGYYALLKLDKHPGYKVEPAELSLDLAKMTPGIRCSPEILFARDVARACRIGNYIAFFRLARKATYLQACLMHAHFAKLRTQALASLHSGLQNNQGIPVSHVVDWLGMEGEDTESLLEYHGFALKKYEEMYMVKEGPFLNSDVDFPTKRSHLVHLKKSKLIIDDAYSGSAIDAPVKSEMVSGATDMVEQNTDSSKTEVWINARDEEMLDFHKTKSAPKAATQPQPLIEVPSPVSVNRENDAKMTGFFLPRGFFLPSSSCLSVDNLVADNAQQGVEQMVESDGYISMDQRLPKSVGHLVQAETPESSECNYMTKKLTPPTDEIRMLDKEASMLIFHQNEVASEKLKLMLRKWKQWASKQREMREQREFLANAALSSLSLGPPVRQIKTPPRHATSELNIDNFARERYGRRGKSWSTLNVSELVAPVLSARNPDAKCLCWKLLIFVQANDTESQKKYLASRWLLSKLMGANKENEDLIVSLSHISIWKTWFATQNSPWTCCLSVIREATFDGNQQVSEDGIIAGTSCIMFLVSESIPWENQRVRLHNLLLSIPSGSNLPLLIFNSDAYEEKITDPSVTIISRLGLHNVDKSRIKSISVVSLVSECPQQHLSGFFSDDKLREGLRWLASHSPLQPAPSLVKTRESVLSYLRCSLEVLENRNATEVAPDCCISAFNEALDRLAEEILAAASKFPNPWPSPEINLLEKSSNEWMVAEMFLPSIGWSSPEGIEPLIRALKACKLPSFSDDFSWLKQGSHMGREIQHQKLEFEKRLFSYMTQLSQLLNADLAAREAAVLVQKGAGLELRGSHYYIIPRWVTIFRRIYNWRLKNLKTGEFSVAYVLEQHLERPSIMGSICRTGAFIPLKSNSSIEESGNYLFSSEGDQPVRSASDDLSFDEIVEVCCNVPHMEHQLPLPISECTPSGVHEAGCASEPTTGAKGNDKDYQTCGAHDDSLAGDRNKQRTLSPLSPKIDRLSVLLENCKRMQDTIDEKLAIYF